MKTKTKKIFVSAIFILLLLNLVSAVSIKSAETDTLAPGTEGEIRIELENNLNDDAKDVSLKLEFTNLPFNPIGSSEESIDEISEGDEERFDFTIKASNDIKPGDYKIPYTLTFKINNEQKQSIGTIGVTVKANPELSFSVTTENPIINTQGKITLKIVNKGFADAKFVTVNIIPEGFTLLSEKEIYIGTIDSDDFETATLDVIFKTKNPTLRAVIEYKDFDNAVITKNISLPIQVYTQDEAIELGITKKSNAPLYIGIVIALILAWILYRIIRKQLRKSKNNKLKER